MVRTVERWSRFEEFVASVTYLVVNALKRAEGIDIVDRDTDFNPFKTAIAEK